MCYLYQRIYGFVFIKKKNEKNIAAGEVRSKNFFEQMFLFGRLSPDFASNIKGI